MNTSDTSLFVESIHSYKEGENFQQRVPHYFHKEITNKLREILRSCHNKQMIIKDCQSGEAKVIHDLSTLGMSEPCIWINHEYYIVGKSEYRQTKDYTLFKITDAEYSICAKRHTNPNKEIYFLLS